MKPRVFCVFLKRSGGVLSQKMLKIKCLEMLFPADFCDIFVEKLSSVACILHSRASSIDGSIHLLFMIPLAISRYS